MCEFCDVHGRNPCYSKAEASRCPNCRNRGDMMDFEPKDVATWLLARAHYGRDEELLKKAAHSIERDL